MVGLLAAVIGFSAFAQDASEDDEASGAPLGLLRLSEDAGDDDDADLGEDEPSVRALPTPPGTNAAVDVGSLGGPSDKAIGLISIQEGGFGQDMWLGTRRLVVENLMVDLPGRSTSPIVRELRRRLLLSKAYDPRGATTGASILSLRVERLYQAGLAEEALQLTLDGKVASRNVYSSDQKDAGIDPDVMETAAQIYLLKDDIQQACTQAVRVRSLSDAPFWSKLRAVCYAIAGDTEKATFAAALLREEAHEDAFFYALLGHATDSTDYALETMSDGGAIHWSLLKLVGEAFPANAVEGADLALLSRISETGIAGGAPADLLLLRIPAAEQAVYHGAFDVDALRALYRSVPIDDAAGIAEVTIVEDFGEGAALRRAATFQAAEKTGDPIVRARFIRQALKEADAAGRWSLAAHIYAPLMVTLPADPVLQARAKEFLSVLILSRDHEAAAKWFSLLERYDLTERRAGHVGAQQDVAAFRTLLALGHPYDSRGISDWRSVSRLTEATSPEAYAHAVLEVRLLEALGFFVPEEAKILMLERLADPQGQMPASGILSGLDAAARAGRQAETALYALVALGDGGPAAAHPTAVTKVVAGLMRVGLEYEAKKVAVEALLAQS